ncbi:methylenetetrahydrofolate reductase (NADPH)-like isoform X2 [Phlebotomus argentipes]|uniref:methylenetetrahydrofolate reductase (NADPH)-like isoform X2 n=1 Tax=Phlebotomus argentipes TaxID=94469 RepID=UPI0028936138|nr:methylenetetrahydrofolate reductase (NADPH)-like isoform X2 [Phlebotomus argentipes]
MHEENSPFGNSSRNLMELIREKISKKQLFYTIQVTPSDPPLNLTSLRPPPLFASITWIADNNLVAFRRNPEVCPALEMARELRNSFPVLSHLTCFKMTSGDLMGITQNENLHSFFAHQGNSLDAANDFPEFRYAAELVKWLRSNRPDATIAVAGYPDGHFLATSLEDDLQRLKEKVDAGADLIITQWNFSAAKVIDFIGKCRSIGIKVTFHPGLFIPVSFESLIAISRLGRIVLDEDIWLKLKQHRENNDAFQEVILGITENWVKEILKEFPEEISGFHLFTWNDLEITQKFINRFSF